MRRAWKSGENHTDGGIAGMKFSHCLGLVLPFLLASAVPSRAQDSPLRGLAAVQVVVSWMGGPNADRDALQTDVELKARQSGLFVLTSEEQAQSSGSMLFIGIGGGGTTVPVIVELREKTYLFRDIHSRMKFTAFNAYAQWLAIRRKEPSPITDAEDKEHQAAVFAEAKENGNLPLAQVLTNPTDAATWLRYGIAQTAQTESVPDIIARYQQIPQFQTPAGRAYLAPLLDHEVQAAIAKAQSPASPGTVRDMVKSYVDAFLNDWLAANSTPR